MNFFFTILMLIQLKSPASFTTDCKPIIIYDSKGQLFLATKFPGKFNLPIGNYTTDCQVTAMPAFVPFPAIPQDAPVQKTGLQVIAEGTKAADYLQFSAANKASFYPDFNVAVFAEKVLKHWFYPVTIFTICHEEGHHYFKTDKKTSALLSDMFADPDEMNDALDKYYACEHACDVYAYNKMMRNGYNPSQCIQAIKLLLDASNPRIQMLIDDIKNAA